MSHYTIDCNWGCEYDSQGNCKRCGENILYYRDKWIKFLDDKYYNINYDFNSKEYDELIIKRLKKEISIDEYFEILNSKLYVKIKISEVNLPDSLEELEDWQKDPDSDHCWLRIVKNGDPNNIKDRRVFVEKTPRVFDPSLNIPIDNSRSWIQGLKGDYDEGEGLDEYSRYWSNVMAKTLGYTFENE